MRLLFGIPTAGSPSTPFLRSLSALQLPENVDVLRYVVSGNYVPAQRELILRNALETQAEFVLMIDDDIELPPDALTALLGVLRAEPRCALAGALYYSRDGLRPMAVAGWDPARTTTAHTPAFTDAPVEVDGVGFGCVLLRTQTLRALETPFLRAQVFLEPHARRARVCNEDYLFCARLREAGLTVMLHPGVRCRHYDASADRFFPGTWEDAHVTGQPRMAVRRADGALALVPYDPNVPQARERHEAAPLDYIFSED